MKYDYPAGVLPEERHIVETFERDIVPYVEKNGSEIGEFAMQGNKDAEEIIRRYHHFITGMPQFREMNLKSCVQACKRFEHTRRH